MGVAKRKIETDCDVFKIYESANKSVTVLLTYFLFKKTTDVSPTKVVCNSSCNVFRHVKKRAFKQNIYM